MPDPTHEGDRAELAEGIDPRSLEEPLNPSNSSTDAENVIEEAVAGVAGTPIFGFENPPIPKAGTTYKDPVTGQPIPAGFQIFLDPTSKRELIDPATGKMVLFQAVPGGIQWSLWDGTNPPQSMEETGWVPPVVTDGSPLLAPDLPDKDAGPVPPPSPVNPGSIRLARPEQGQTADQLLWTLIRNRTNAISFNNYFNFMNSVLCGSEPGRGGRRAPTNEFRLVMGELRNLGTNGFDVLKGATELFLQHEAGIIVNPIPGNTSQGQAQAQALQQMYDPMISPEGEVVRRNFDKLPADWVDQLRRSYYDNLTPNTPVLPYFTMILDRLQDLAPKGGDEILTNCYGVLPGWVTGPLAIELIWSYWHEEGMLAQTFNAICNRFQNRRLGNNGVDPLARLEIDPLRRLNHYIWAWIQNEPFRLSVRRRAFEYDHEYGLRLLGRAVGTVRGADVRSKFLEALHNLLYTAVIFHLQDDDLTVQADGFPVLNALRETQLVLTEGSHNQYGDLPWVARVEMLMQLWMLGRPEMREFLGGRVMVPYIEPWMDRVDTVKSMLGWTPTNVTHFRDLGVFGEQMLLSVRYGTWAKEIRPEAAANWARYWRPEIQGYVHAYRAATGVDLRQGVDANMPGALLQRRLSAGAKAALTR